ncbi:MAG TPA: agmatinase [Phycisphaerales bacterium]|nr:agmatinase [Phycisphaerales bacterium]HMP36949.1 agmatinase [Phycisphaerales bacterium]
MPTPLPDGRRTPRFAGICTFCRFPALEAEQAGASGSAVEAASASARCEGSPPEWALYGVPFDGGVTYRPGARFGPRAIREESQYIKPYDLELGIDIAATLSCVDAGDAPTSPYSCAETQERALDFARGLGAPGRTRLLAVGGDHSIALANLRATHARLGAGGSAGIALLHLDAHLDTVESVWGERLGHGSPFIRAIEEGVVDPTAMLSVGIRGPLNSPRDLDFARDRGVEILRADAIGTPAAEEALARFRSRVAGRPLYVSFDVDVLDPAFAPGTGTPVCGGLSTREALAVLQRMAGLDLIGADVVEVLPDRDAAGITALAASHVILRLLALAATARRGAAGAP